jgi:hypothetical protein
MGNVCCVGRVNSQTPQIQPSRDLLEIKTLPNDLNPSSPSNAEKTLSLPDSKLNLKFDTVQFFSQRSSPENGLDYSLITAEDLSRSQQQEILKVLDTFKFLLDPDEQEMVDGLLKVTSIEEYFLMITTHALYLLDLLDLSQVFKRFKLEDLSYLVLTKTMKSVYLIGNSIKTVFSLSTHDMKNLILSIQQVSFEAFAQYLPWVVVDDFGRLDEYLVKVELNLLSEENLAVTKVFVEHGDIGEVALVVQKCSESGKNRMMNLVLLVSNRAVYMLNSSFQFVEKILLAAQVNVRFNGRNSVLTVSGHGQSFDFVVELELAEKVQRIIREFDGNY